MTEPALRFELAVRARPCAGEFVNGDLVCWKLAGESTFVLVLDAAGHGKEARRVAELAEDAFRVAHLDDPAAFLYALDAKLRGGRGAAAALARLDPGERRLQYAGVGNISARLVGHGETHLVSRDGTLGQHFRLPKVQTLELRAQDLLVMHSDGISGRFSSEGFAELTTGEAPYVATQLLERFGRIYDDASCAVVRFKP